MAETPQEREEAARVRRRWLNIGEVVAIVAVLISALTFWNSYRERTNSEAEHAREASENAKKAAALILEAIPDKEGASLDLAPRSSTQAIQSQTIRFPTELGVSAAETSSDARIERKWFASELLKARKQAGVEDRPGDARLPVVIETHFITDGDPHIDRAVYEVGYSTSHSLLGGSEIHLKGLSRHGQIATIEAGQKKIDALWRVRMEGKK